MDASKTKDNKSGIQAEYDDFENINIYLDQLSYLNKIIVDERDHLTRQYNLIKDEYKDISRMDHRLDMEFTNLNKQLHILQNRKTMLFDQLNSVTTPQDSMQGEIELQKINREISEYGLRIAQILRTKQWGLNENNTKTDKKKLIENWQQKLESIQSVILEIASKYQNNITKQHEMIAVVEFEIKKHLQIGRAHV